MFHFSNLRCIIVDNFFTSIPMAKNLYNKGLTIIGTLRANKIEIPELFLPDKSKSLFSSQFCYYKFLILFLLQER